MKCPRCGIETESDGNPFRPFCSDRCKLLDLGNWISGEYRIPGENALEEENVEPDPQKDLDKA
jgi:endogenous inhibitor of DNA gyrase (YacG/DUF329 family)